jgi:hypothetical protein
MLFKKGVKLKNNEQWHMEGQKQEVVSEIIYLRVKLESAGGWRRQKVRSKTIGSQSLLAIDKHLTRMPNVMYETLIYSGFP